MVCVPSYRGPTHPVGVLCAEILGPLGLSQRTLAESIHVPYRHINEIADRKRGVTPSTALRLEKFLGISAHFWLNLERQCDPYHTKRAERADLYVIQPRTFE